MPWRTNHNILDCGVFAMRTCWVDELSSVRWTHRITPKYSTCETPFSLWVSAHKPVGAGLHLEANGQADDANREIVKGIEKRM
ncbi:hypothetical protein Tco_1207757 [Tanacetum coccineum]